MSQRVRWEENDRLRVTIEWDGKMYRARCREYDLTATGNSLTEARDALWSMIQHYIALTDAQVWNDYFSSVQEELDEDVNNGWATGDHIVN